MTEKYELAQKDYEAGMKYKDIAAKYDVKLNTVKSWKSRYWNKGAPPEKSVHTKRKKVAHKIVDELVDNDDLTDKQKTFCLYYLQRFNATWAYMKAYGVNYATASAAGARMLVNVKVQTQLTELKKSIADDLHLTAVDIASEYAKQAFSDVGDYLSFKTIDTPIWERLYRKNGPFIDNNGHYDYVEVTDPNTGKPAMHTKHEVRFKDQSMVDTSLIKSIKTDKGEVNLELYDRMQALNHLNKLVEDSKLDRAIKQQQLEKVKADAKLSQAKVDLISGAVNEADTTKLIDDIGGDTDAHSGS